VPGRRATTAEVGDRARAAVATWRQVDGALDHQRARSIINVRARLD
jgi:hypothetical protein